MSRLVDRTGKKYGLLTVIKRVENRGRRSMWLCLCECGNEAVICGDDLQSGHTRSCGCMQKKWRQQNKFNDLTGKRFGRLEVKYLDHIRNYKPYWKCVCDCGDTTISSSGDLVSGHTLSCGCLNREKLSQRSVINLVGQRFYRLVVLERSGSNSQQSAVWKCSCDCGNICYVPTVSLTHGLTKSCGCYKSDVTSRRSCKDLSGYRNGIFTVICATRERKHGRQVWKCICDCGKTFYAQTTDIQNGKIKSCGCLKSFNEAVISKYLDQHHILYDRQKVFIGCNNINSLPFDFYLPDYNIAIEYDGEFHYIEFDKLGNDLEGQQSRDAIKTKYCEENDIILLRIPYWEKDNIESILSDWLFLNDAEDANSLDVDLSS